MCSNVGEMGLQQHMLNCTELTLDPVAVALSGIHGNKHHLVPRKGQDWENRSRALVTSPHYFIAVTKNHLKT